MPNTVRSVMRCINFVQPTETVDEFVMSFDAQYSGNDGGISQNENITFTFLWTDTLAQIRSKMIDALVARATERD